MDDGRQTIPNRRRANQADQAAIVHRPPSIVQGRPRMTGSQGYEPFAIAISGPAGAPSASLVDAPGASQATAPLDLADLPAVRGLLDQVRAGARDPGTVAALGR